MVALAQYGATADDLASAFANDRRDQNISGQAEFGNRLFFGSATGVHFEFEHLDLSLQERRYLSNVSSNKA